MAANEKFLCEGHPRGVALKVRLWVWTSVRLLPFVCSNCAWVYLYIYYMYEGAGRNSELAVEQRACLLLSLGLLDYVMCSGFDRECYYIPVVP